MALKAVKIHEDKQAIYQTPPPPKKKSVPQKSWI